MGPMCSTSDMTVPMTPTTVSRMVASRSVPRNACQANIGITAKMTSGASALTKTAIVVPRVSTPCTTRSRGPASGSKVSVWRNSGSRTIRAAALAPKAPRAPSQGLPWPVAHAVRPQPSPAIIDDGGDRADQPGDVALVEQCGATASQSAHEQLAHGPGGGDRARTETERDVPVVAVASGAPAPSARSRPPAVRAGAASARSAGARRRARRPARSRAPGFRRRRRGARARPSRRRRAEQQRRCAPCAR